MPIIALFRVAPTTDRLGPDRAARARGFLETSCAPGNPESTRRDATRRHLRDFSRLFSRSLTLFQTLLRFLRLSRTLSSSTSPRPLERRFCAAETNCHRRPLGVVANRRRQSSRSSRRFRLFIIPIRGKCWRLLSPLRTFPVKCRFRPVAGTAHRAND
jgi:hypothetical protein